MLYSLRRVKYGFHFLSIWRIELYRTLTPLTFKKFYYKHFIRISSTPTTIPFSWFFSLCLPFFFIFTTFLGDDVSGELKRNGFSALTEKFRIRWWFLSWSLDKCNHNGIFFRFFNNIFPQQSGKKKRSFIVVHWWAHLVSQITVTLNFRYTPSAHTSLLVPY